MKHAAKLPSSRSSPATSAHRLSHAIAKAPPRKIRIIHVLAPEVIKTEARHFRELVQRLTGKPAPSGAFSPAASTGDASSTSPPPAAPAASDYSCDTAGDEGSGAAAAAAIDVMKVKEEPETSSSGGSSSSGSGGEGGGFLRALELDGCNDAFFKELDDFLFGCCDHMESSGFGF
ncbi:hypothetical protein BS78_06G272900 [Paspalum vaginatum]|nr:hypothetical protein BS78_06G272900 [Paspalum vaginatum]